MGSLLQLIIGGIAEVGHWGRGHLAFNVYLDRPAQGLLPWLSYYLFLLGFGEAF